jgi:hypothetical protein
MTVTNTQLTEADLVPGTELLLAHENNEDQIVLIPEPSDNPDDPLVGNSNTTNIASTNTMNKELEPNMEVYSYHQSSDIRIRQRAHASLHRTFDTNFYPRVP